MSGESLDRQQVAALRSALEERRSELEDQLRIGGDAARPVSLDQQSVGRVSRVDAIQQQQMALAGREQAELLLRQITQALQRIDDGVYGICLHCEQPIAAARLVAQPQVSLCVNCQAASERD
ncbi:MAG TPA: TraR/DksA family transcriptional regulator [Gammaproteobacteria bacterium]|jgi:DnaK suppressor protein